MPGKSGVDVCRELKADGATRGIPVIIFTAHYSEEECLRTSCEDIGADGYMIKPFDPQALLARIKSMIK